MREGSLFRYRRIGEVPDSPVSTKVFLLDALMSIMGTSCDVTKFGQIVNTKYIGIDNKYICTDNEYTCIDNKSCHTVSNPQKELFPKNRRLS